MEASGSNGVSSLTNDMVLRGLLELFGAAFSLDQITSAYYKAGKNADDAAEALATFAPNGRETFRLPINSIYKKSPYQENGNPRASKLKYRPVSLDSSVLPMSENWVENDESCSSRDEQLHQGMEDFLFSMLGVGFKLERDQIRQVLDGCGYDMEKSMEKLINLPASTSEKRNELIRKSSEKSAYLSLKYKASPSWPTCRFKGAHA
nr:putative nuclear RNA export factor SDE5 [Malus domestica]